MFRSVSHSFTKILLFGYRKLLYFCMKCLCCYSLTLKTMVETKTLSKSVQCDNKYNL
jgi:hypothetical protein